MEALGRGEKEVVINRLTGHIVVKVSVFESFVWGICDREWKRGGERLYSSGILKEVKLYR